MSEEQNILSPTDSTHWWTKVGVLITAAVAGFGIGAFFAQERIQLAESQLEQCIKQSETDLRAANSKLELANSSNSGQDISKLKNQNEALQKDLNKVLSEREAIGKNLVKLQKQLVEQTNLVDRLKKEGYKLSEENKAFSLKLEGSENVGGFRFFFKAYDDYYGHCGISYHDKYEVWYTGSSRAIGNCKLYLMKCAVPSEWLYECQSIN